MSRFKVQVLAHCCCMLVACCHLFLKVEVTCINGRLLDSLPVHHIGFDSFLLIRIPLFHFHVNIYASQWRYLVVFYVCAGINRCKSYNQGVTLKVLM